MQINRLGLLLLGLLLPLGFAAEAETTEYSLTIEQGSINLTGKPVTKITTNGSIPAPTLYFTEGDEAQIHVTNNLNEATSIHWHGLILDGSMDGVDGFNGYKSIAAGESFTYQFPIQQAGTYWYHSHSDGQEQDGLYGAIIITPKAGEAISTERDYVVLLSDFMDIPSQEIMANLQNNPHDPNMMSAHLADVTGYTFLVNGKSPDQNWTGLFKAGEKVRLRFINGSAMSYFDIRIPGLQMSVIAADGQEIEPVVVEEFRFAPAETYDVVVTPTLDQPYPIVAEPIDRSGFALGTLATSLGQKGKEPEHRPEPKISMPAMDMSQMAHGEHDMTAMTDSWEDTGVSEGGKYLSYKDLVSLNVHSDVKEPEREIVIRLGQDMDSYTWTINDKIMDEAEPLLLQYGERVRLTFINETMMAHPMHLHGMFFELENGQPADRAPKKHTVNIAPMQTYSVLLTADQIGEWAFHCHLLYHMNAGMMQKVIVSDNLEGGNPTSASDDANASMDHTSSHMGH